VATSAPAPAKDEKKKRSKGVIMVNSYVPPKEKKPEDFMKEMIETYGHLKVVSRFIPTWLRKF